MLSRRRDPALEVERIGFYGFSMGGFSPGLHNSDFAMRELPGALAFLSDHLTH